MDFSYFPESNGWIGESEDDKGTKRRERDEDTEAPSIQRNEVFIATPFPKKPTNSSHFHPKNFVPELSFIQTLPIYHLVSVEPRNVQPTPILETVEAFVVPKQIQMETNPRTFNANIDNRLPIADFVDSMSQILIPNFNVQNLESIMSKVDNFVQTTTITDVSPDETMFYLLEQPQSVQRKSYKNENRCLLPNPLSIALKPPTENQTHNDFGFIDGRVSVQLVGEFGERLNAQKNQPVYVKGKKFKQDVLECVRGSLTKTLDLHHSAHFSLKVTSTSKNRPFHLLFEIEYKVDNQWKRERILTDPFKVLSNRTLLNKLSQVPKILTTVEKNQDRANSSEISPLRK